MKPYDANELVMVAHRSMYALYSLSKMEEKARDLDKYSIEEKMNHPTLTLFIFYQDNFTHNLSELLTYFYNQKDQRILSLLVTSEEQRSRLREVRHSNAHLDNVKQTTRRQADLDILKVLPYLTSDLLTIIKFIRVILKEYESEEEANKYKAHIEEIRAPFT